MFFTLLKNQEKMKLKPWYTVSLTILFVFLSIFIVGFLISLLNIPSDAYVAGALIGILFYIPTAAWIIYKLIKFTNKQFKMKKISNVAAILLLMLTMSFVSCTTVPPGEVGIKVNNLGDNRGVQNLTTGTGAMFYMPGVSSVFCYPTFTQTAIWCEAITKGSPIDESITFNTKEGTPVSGDISLSYQLKEKGIPGFYVKYRVEINTWTHGYLRNVARDKFQEIGGKYTLDSLYGPGKEKFLTEVRNATNKVILPDSAEIIQFGFTGPLRMDTAILHALNRKLANAQNALAEKNKILQYLAIASQDSAKAAGIAKANDILAKSISPQLIQWEQLQVQREQLKKWDGAMPTTMLGSGTGMMINLGSSTSSTPISKK